MGLGTLQSILRAYRSTRFNQSNVNNPVVSQKHLRNTAAEMDLDLEAGAKEQHPGKWARLVQSVSYR
jgi:hypothetical protein